MSSHAEDDLEDGLDEAERIGLIRESTAGIYSFDHNLTQQALHSQLSKRRCRRLHRAAAGVIEKLPEEKREKRAGELAWHFMEGGEPESAIPYALLAGDQAEAVFAHTEAALHYRTAVRLADEADDETLRAQAYEKLAAPLHRSSRYAEALTALEEAAAVYERRRDFASLLPVMAEIAGVHGNRGTPHEGMTRLEPLLPELEATAPSSSLVYLYASLGSLLFVLGRSADHLSVAQRSAATAETLDDPRALAVAKEQLGLALLQLRRRDEARDILEEAMELADSAGDIATFELALNNAAYAAELRGELDKSIGHFERGLELARRLGDPAQQAFMAYALGRNHLEKGDLRQARAYGQEALELSCQTGPSWVAPYPLLGLGKTLLTLGDPEAAAYLQDGRRVAEENADVQALDIAHGFLAELDLRQGNPRHAEECLRSAGVTPEWEPAQSAVSLPTALTLAQALAKLDKISEAMIVVDKVMNQAQEAGERLVLTEALALRGVLLIESGDWRRAEESFHQAEDLAREIHYPYAEALALSGDATMHVRQGETELARERLSEALVIWHRLQAATEIEETERALSALV